MPPAKPHHVAHREVAPKSLEDGDDWAEVLAEGDYIGATVEEIAWSDVIARGGRWSGVTVERFQATDVRFENCDLAGLVLQEEVSLRRVEFVGCRMTGAVLAGAHLRDVRFADCAIDDTNMRMVDLHEVAFEDCTMGGIDFYAAKLAAVTAQRFDLRGADFTKATMREVDLRASRLEDVIGADALRGATIDSLQVLALASSLARALGITVGDEDGA